MFSITERIKNIENVKLNKSKVIDLFKHTFNKIDYKTVEINQFQKTNKPKLISF